MVAVGLVGKSEIMTILHQNLLKKSNKITVVIISQKK